jgi:molybdopterin-containing oxidoreductase family membrane subunit
MAIEQREHLTTSPSAAAEAALLSRTPPVITPGHTFNSVTDTISHVVLTKRTPLGWFLGFFVAFVLLMILNMTIGNLLLTGIGIWGNNVPVGWAFDIINFVWWIGIGHAGTLISAILLLLNQDWRASINRFAEAMTIFAVMCAGLFPVIHTGRPWLAFWLFPYPNSMEIWPNFRSPLVWDVFAVSTYATVSILFWYVGLLPDLASLRDRAEGKVMPKVYGILSLGWRGSAIHWDRYETAFLLLAGLSTPLVVSVHSVVSFDFAISLIPGWHATIFPPYFVAGAVYAGFAMVLTIAIPLRVAYNMKDFITDRHLDLCACVMLATGLFVDYGYATEAFMAWFSSNTYETFMMTNRMGGPSGWAYWTLILCNFAAIQPLWFSKVRNTPVILFIVCMFVNVGMWLERYVIVVTSLQHDYMPSAWGMYYPTVWDIMTFIGTLGLFTTLIFLFIRFLPMISIFEMRTLVPEAELKEGGHH